MSVKIAVYFYSTYGHMYKMAKAAVEGIKEAGAEAELLRVPETLPTDVLKALGADEAQKAFAGEKGAKFDEIGNYDGYVFAFPTRFGVVPAQFKAFLDATGQTWAKGGLESKPVAMMTSSAMQHWRPGGDYPWAHSLCAPPRSPLCRPPPQFWRSRAT